MIHEKIYLYDGRKDVTLTTYVLDDSNEMLAGKKRPAVLIAPGGAYLGCSDREGEPVAMAFANMGYHAFVLRYSVYNAGENTLFPKPGEKLTVKPHCVFPNPVRDMGKAMLVIRERSNEWLVDTDKIAICGFSAGGHLCAMYSVLWNKPVISDFFKASADQFKPAAAILCYPLTDYIFMKSSIGSDPVAKSLFDASSVALLGTANASDAQLESVSAAHLVDKDTPPAFIWSTSEDALVPVQHSTLMATSLANHNIPFELHIFEKGRHGLSTATQSSAGTMIEIDDDVAKWLPLCGEWLRKRFAFSLPKTREW